MTLKLPDKFNRKAIKSNFDKLPAETWDYLFDYEKENGLVECRTEGWGVRFAWYSIPALKAWLIDRGYYTQSDFDARGWPIQTRMSLRGLNVRTHVLA